MGNKTSKSSKTSTSLGPLESYEGIAHRVDPLYQLEDTKKVLKIKLKKSQRTTGEQPSSLVDSYKINGRKRCTALIINNADGESRKGADVDAKNMANLLKAIKSTIVVKNNLNTNEMVKCFESFAKNPKLADFDICIIVILANTKATIDNKLTGLSGAGSDDEYVSVTDIVRQFGESQCPHLLGKPKIFVFQGPSVCDRVGPDTLLGKLDLKDIFIANALLMGKLQKREIGSYYIQALCKVFMKYAYDEDLESIIKKVDEIVYMHDKSTQHTYYQSINFTKKCYFNPT